MQRVIPPSIPNTIDWVKEASLFKELLTKLYPLDSLPISKRKSTFHIKSFPENEVDSICVNTFAFKKQNPPTHARTLFIHRPSQGDARIVIRGYDKFYNLDEVQETKYNELVQQKQPFEVTVKENGCIISIGAMNETNLLIASKHSLASKHSQKAREWLEKHLSAVKLKTEDLASYLWRNKLTAVCELIDESFEEHVLEYPPSSYGLWLHGLNFNTVNFSTLPQRNVEAIGHFFGLLIASFKVFPNFKAAYEYSRNTHQYQGRDIEGYVIRSLKFPFQFVKIKFDRPYLLYREWREITNLVLRQKPVFTFKFPEESRLFYNWVKINIQKNPDLFKNHLQFQGIYRVRKLFLEETKSKSKFLKSSSTSTLSSSSSPKNATPPSPTDSNENLLPSSDSSSKLLIIPIGTIGLGKTTIGRMLAHCLNAAHVQRDLLPRKNKPKNGMPLFHYEILNSFLTYNEVYADRNHPVVGHRRKLVQDVQNVYPDVKVVYIDWDIDDSFKKAFQLSKQRVLQRGEEHPTLTPGKTPHFEEVLKQFLRLRRPLTSQELENGSLLHLDPTLCIRDVMCKVFDHLNKVAGLRIPSSTELNQALEMITPNASMSMESLKDSLPLSPTTTIAPPLSSSVNKRSLPYYALTMDTIPPSPIDIPSDLILKSEFHCTVFHSNDQLHTLPGMSKSQTKKHIKKKKQQYQPLLGHSFTIEFIDFRWNSNCAAFGVRLPDLPSELQPKYPHITFALAKNVKPKQAIELFDGSCDQKELHIFSYDKKKKNRPPPISAKLT